MTRTTRLLSAVLMISFLFLSFTVSCDGGGGDSAKTGSHPALFGMNLQPDMMKRYEEVFVKMSELGVRWARVGAAWEKLEPEPGRFEWSALDGIIGSAQGHGLSLLITIGALSRWGSTRPPSTMGKPGYQASSPPRDMSRYSAFVEALVNHCRGKGIVWQIENEPNAPAFWDGTQQEYVELLKAGYGAAHRADPEAVVLAAGLACGFSRPDPLEIKMEGIRSWYDAILDSGAYDALDAHDYYPPEEDNPLGITFRGYIQSVKGWMKAKEVGVPLWVSEAGVSSVPIQLGGSTINFTPERQARDLKLVYEAASDEGIPHLFWLKLVDTQEGTFTNMGLIGSDLSRKPAWETYRELAAP